MVLLLNPTSAGDFLRAEQDEAVVRAAQVAVSRQARCVLGHLAGNRTCRFWLKASSLHDQKASVFVGRVAPQPPADGEDDGLTSVGRPEPQLRGMQTECETEQGLPAPIHRSVAKETGRSFILASGNTCSLLHRECT